MTHFFHPPSSQAKGQLKIPRGLHAFASSLKRLSLSLLRAILLPLSTRCCSNAKISWIPCGGLYMQTPERFELRRHTEFASIAALAHNEIALGIYHTSCWRELNMLSYRPTNRTRQHSAGRTDRYLFPSFRSLGLYFESEETVPFVKEISDR